MEFSSRGFQRPNAQPAANQGHGAAAAGSPSGQQNKLSGLKGPKSLSTLWIVFFVSITVLVVALILALSTKNANQEASLINKDDYQVVAFVDKQAYFGKITSITDKYVVLRDVFYLQDNNGSQSTTSTNSTLIKRGCEIHRPQDQMVIYRDQINFWENMENNGKVVQAIKDFKKANPKGQDCSQVTNSQTQQSTDNSSTNNTSTNNNSNSTNTNTNNSTTNKNNSGSTNNNSTTQP
jgi:hypothetical protein